MIRDRWRFLLIGLAYALLVWTSAWGQSLTSDEVPHLAAGYSYVRTGDYRMNREHPPLVKLLGGLAILPLRPELPLDHPSWEAGNQWEFGAAFLDRNEGRVEELVRWARLPAALLAGLLVAIAGLWAFECYGLPAALVTVALLGGLPEVIGHGRWLTTDVPAAALGLLALYAAWKWAQRPGPWLAAGVGLAFGAALAAKFSMVVWPLLLVILLAARIRAGEPRPGGRDALWLALWLLLGPALVLGLCYGQPTGLGWYVHEIRTVNANHRPFYPRYFLGEYHYGRIPGYFLGAFALKTPLAAIAALAAGAAAGLWALLARSSDRTLIATLLGGSAVLVAVVEIAADPIGLRYLIPAYPLLAILAGRLMTKLPRGADRIALALVVAGTPVAAWLHRADLGGAFNVAAPRPALQVLDDVNLDWGQGLIALRERMVERSIARVGYGSPYGIAPRWYGVAADPVEPRARGHLPPGWYALSPQFLLRMPGFYWLAFQAGEAVSGLKLLRLGADADRLAGAWYASRRPDDWLAAFHFAAFAHAAGRPAAALGALDRCLAARPGFLQALDLRARIRCEAGDARGCEADHTAVAQRMQAPIDR